MFWSSRKCFVKKNLFFGVFCLNDAKESGDGGCEGFLGSVINSVNDQTAKGELETFPANAASVKIPIFTSTGRRNLPSFVMPTFLFLKHDPGDVNILNTMLFLFIPLKRGIFWRFVRGIRQTLIRLPQLIDSFQRQMQLFQQSISPFLPTTPNR
mmetsp:Transcript_1527/g.3422  ORF Transcript_1527/g.3422 Transcript_1527/m.3422 type:complete len:154 (-) Transcript_1527:178-639(-)